MARYLLTGAAGFIAARVGEMLLDEGHTIVGVDNLNDAYDVRIKQHRLERLKTYDSFSFQQLDISDRAAVESLGGSAGQVDAVLNLAARAGVRSSVENPWVYIDTNMTGTLNLLELCRRLQVPKFILASTSSVYGAHNSLPYSEDADCTRPLQPYAASKLGAEALCHSHHHLYGIDVTIFRYFTVYGPAGRPDMVMFRFVQWVAEGRVVQINGDGRQSRGFTYVDDIARGTILGLKPVGYEIINLGGHEVVEIVDLLRMVEQKVGRQAEVVHHPMHPADARANWADVRKAKRLLAWEPRVGLEEGLDQLVAWYQRERDWASQIQT